MKSLRKQSLNEFIETNKDRYNVLSTFQEKLNQITKESYPELISIISKYPQFFFKDHSTTIFSIRNVIRFSKYNLKKMELILDIIVTFSKQLTHISEYDFIDSSDNVLNIINYFFYKKLISIETIIQKSIFCEELFVNFIPEIEEYDGEYAELRKKQLIKEFEEKPYLKKLQNFYNLVIKDRKKHVYNRQMNFHPSKLHKSIRDDDVDTFQSILSNNNLSINYRIEYSIYERAHTPDENMSLIQVASIYGSLKIFKFLWIQKDILIDKNIQRYANYGNNYEIIHLIDEKSSHVNVVDDLIAFNRHDLLNYFLENYPNEFDENDKRIQSLFEKEQNKSKKESVKKKKELNKKEYNSKNFESQNHKDLYLNQKEDSMKLSDNYEVDLSFEIKDIESEFNGELLMQMMSYQNLLCAVTFYNIPVIISCLSKIIFIVKNIENENNLLILKSSEYDIELFQFLFSNQAKERKLDIVIIFQLFYQAIKMNSFDAFKFLFDLIHDKINLYLIFKECIQKNSLFANFLLDSVGSEINRNFKNKVSIEDLLLAVDYYDADVVYKMIKLFIIIDNHEKQFQFVLKLVEKLSKKMIKSLFNNILPILTKEILLSIYDILNSFEIFDICEIILEYLSKKSF